MNCNSSYFNLPDEDSELDYLRTRLSYSFRRIERRERDKRKYYLLSEPTLESGMFSAKFHNFWKRGNIFYMAGKLIAQHSMSNLWKTHMELRTNPLWDEVSGTSPELPPVFPYDTYNVMQMEKIWRFTQANVLDRERLVFTNVFQAVELCLKAVMTHARFRKCGEFTFDYGHDITELYGLLPESLQHEIASESEVFTGAYRAFREQAEADIQEIHSRWWRNPGRRIASQADWARIAERIDNSDYIHFTNANDPVPYDGWFEKTLNRMREEKGLRSGIYPRYAPLEDVDELPTDLVAGGLLLGRFMYEHLFPMSLVGDD